MYNTFFKSVCKDKFFDATFDLFKETKFSSLRMDNEPFLKT
jgi:pentatricopeptide repeat protein